MTLSGRISEVRITLGDGGGRKAMQRLQRTLGVSSASVATGSVRLAPTDEQRRYLGIASRENLDWGFHLEVAPDFGHLGSAAAAVLRGHNALSFDHIGSTLQQYEADGSGPEVEVDTSGHPHQRRMPIPNNLKSRRTDAVSLSHACLRWKGTAP